jgi:hypothetical protein
MDLAKTVTGERHEEFVKQIKAVNETEKSLESISKL